MNRRAPGSRLNEKETSSQEVEALVLPRYSSERRRVRRFRVSDP